MAGTVARWVRGIIGFSLMAGGYSLYSYPANVIWMGIGLIILLAAMYNISVLAPLFGYPLKGSEIIRRIGELNDIPGEEQIVIHADGSTTIKDKEAPVATKTKTPVPRAYRQDNLQATNNKFEELE
jgi:hypothetical protein